MALFKTEARIQIVGLIFLIAISVILAQLWRVQVVKGDFYTQKIRGAGEVTVRIPSVRGEIRDRHGLALATNRPSFSVEFYLKEMVTGYQQAFGKKNTPTLTHKFTVKGVYKEDTQPDVGRIVSDIVLPRMAELGIHEDIDADDLQKHYYNDTLVPYTYLDDIDFAQMAKLSERDLGLPGARVTIGGVRVYPYGAVGAPRRGPPGGPGAPRGGAVIIGSIKRGILSNGGRYINESDVSPADPIVESSSIRERLAHALSRGLKGGSESKPPGSQPM